MRNANREEAITEIDEAHFLLETPIGRGRIIQRVRSRGKFLRQKRKPWEKSRLIYVFFSFLFFFSSINKNDTLFLASLYKTSYSSKTPREQERRQFKSRSTKWICFKIKTLILEWCCLYVIWP